MADTAITYQKLIDAHTDADSLRDFTNGAPYTQIKTRLGRYVWTLATFNRMFEEFQAESQDIVNQFQDAITTIVQNDGIPAETVIVGDSRLDVFANEIKSKELDYNKIVTVGDGGDFTTINAALEYLTKMHPCYVTNDANLRAKILLKSGFIAKEQININGLQLNWIDLSSEDAEVQVDRTFLTQKDDRWYYFIRCKNGSIPNIDTLFTMINRTANDDSTMLYMNHSDGFVNPNKGFKNAGSRNVDLTQASSLVCSRGIFTGAGVLNFRPATGSKVFMQYADVSDAPSGVHASTGAIVSAADLICNNCNTGISIQCAVIDLTLAKFSNCTNYSIRALSAAASIHAHDITIDGGQYGIYAENGANIDVENAKISNQSIGALVAINGSRIAARKAELLNNTSGVISMSGSTIVVTDEGTKINGSTTNSLYALTGGTIIANNANYQKTVGTDSNTDARVATSGKIIALGGVGGSSQKPNKVTVNGLIDKGGLAKNNGSAVIPVGAKSIVVNHGLSDTPTMTIATPNGDITPATKWWCGVRTATTFTISVDVELTQAMQFYWTAEI